MSQMVKKTFLILIILIIILPTNVNAWDWGDFHKFAVVFFTILGFGLGFGGILIVVYFGFMRNCLKKHQEDVLHTHRAFHPWPPGSVQWERQKTYRENTERSMRNEGVSNQYDKTNYETANIPYNTLSNYPYEIKEKYDENIPYNKKGLEEQGHSTNELFQKPYLKTSFNTHNISPSFTHIETQFTQPEVFPYNTSYQISSPYSTYKYQEMINNIEQSPYLKDLQSPYLINNKNISTNQQLQPSPLIYSSIQKERTSLKRNISPNSRLSQMRNEKNDNLIIRNTTLINEEQSFRRMDTHTYI